MNAPLARLVDLVIDDDALVSIAGRRAGIVAIPEPARAIALAALAETSDHAASGPLAPQRPVGVSRLGK